MPRKTRGRAKKSKKEEVVPVADQGEEEMENSDTSNDSTEDDEDDKPSKRSSYQAGSGSKKGRAKKPSGKSVVEDEEVDVENDESGLDSNNEVSRKSSSRRAAAAAAAAPQQQQQQQQQQPSVAAHIRDRQRAVAEREAARLARPDESGPLGGRSRRRQWIGHANRKKSAVVSTPTGVHRKGAVQAGNAAWCGPFSVAREMIAQREQARREREQEEEEAGGESHPLDEAMQAMENERKRKEHPSIQWKSSRKQICSGSTTAAPATSPDGKRKKIPSLYLQRQRRSNKRSTTTDRKGQSLYQLCLNFLVDNFDAVESVGWLDADLRRDLANALVARRNGLDGLALQALVVPGMEALELVDASQITAPILVEVLETLLSPQTNRDDEDDDDDPSGLLYLHLDQAGRCFGPDAVEVLCRGAPNPNEAGATAKDATKTTHRKTTALQALSIGGAYLLQDADAARLVRSLQSSLSSLSFRACPLVGMEFVKSLWSSAAAINSQASSPSWMLQELALEELQLSEETYEVLFFGNSASRNDQAQSTTEKEMVSTNRKLKAEDDSEENRASDDSNAQQQPWWSHLQSLRLRRLPGLTDEMVEMVLMGTPLLTALDLSHNYQLTDATLAAIRQAPCCAGLPGSPTPEGKAATNYSSSSRGDTEHGPSLRQLSLNGLKELTEAGLQALFLPLNETAAASVTAETNDDDKNQKDGTTVGVIPSVPPPPRLQRLQLGHCDYQAVSDNVIRLAAEASCVTKSAIQQKYARPPPPSSVAKDSNATTPPGTGLIHLDVQGASLLTDTSMEVLVATSGASLQELNVSFCTHVTDKGLGYLVDSCGSQLARLEVWGLAQLTEEFLDGHRRTSDESLVVEGVWMKKVSSVF